MRIGIDARLYGLEHAGLGRYVTRLISGLLKNDKKNHYVLFLKKSHVDEFKDYQNVTVKEVNIPIYGFREQLLLPFIFSAQKLDLLHVPHFNAPLLYPGKLIITVHDLIKHHSKGKETTTRHPFFYHVKRLGYLFLVSSIVNKAAKILTPSQYVKNDLIKNFGLKDKKITVTYEAVDPQIKEVVLTQEDKKQTLNKYGLVQPFVIYTGSVYPHKNVDLLIDAVIKHNQTKEVDLMLAIVCARNVFYERMNRKIVEKGAQGYIKMLGFLPDEEVNKLYSLALSLVHPSKMEGFGLTGLEAMKAGLTVISSSASCLPEVYGDAALFFDPENVDDLVNKMELVIGDLSLRESLQHKGFQQVKKYSWRKMVKETLSVYKSLSK